MSEASDAASSFFGGGTPALLDDSDGHSNPDSHPDSHRDSDALTDSDTESSLPDFQVGLLLSREEDMLGMIPARRAKYTVEDAKADFISRVADVHGIGSQAVEDAITAIAPFPPIFCHTKDAKVLPLPIDATHHTRSMDSFFSNNSGLLIFQMGQNFRYPSKNSICEEEAVVEQNALALTMGVVENLKMEMTKMREEMQQSETKMREEMKQSERKLLDEIARETARAAQAEQALERATAAQADNIVDTNAYIASGDTLSYNRIRVRHLLNLGQAQLAYCTGLSTTPEERDAAKLWRNYCSSLQDVPRGEGRERVDSRVDQAKRFIRKRRNTKDITATNALIFSGALELLVNDWDLRSRGDTAAHPGPVKKNDLEGYRLAIIDVCDEEQEKYLTGCLAYVFPE